MFGGKGGLGNLMKQAQQMQDKMAKVQEEIAAIEVTGESGAGLVKSPLTARTTAVAWKSIPACWKMTKICWKI